MEQTLLQLNQLSKSYGRLKAVDQLTITLKKGNVYGLLGPNGSGKSTTLGMVLNVVNPTSGSFQWYQGALDTHQALKQIGAIIERPNFYPYMTALQNLNLICKIKQCSTDSIQEKLELVGLWERRHSKFRTYSLGMKQRLAIAAALVNDPELLILDEPTNGLDPEGIHQIRALITKIAEEGTTILLASHLLDEVEKVCNQVIVLKNGVKYYEGPVDGITQTYGYFELKAKNLEALESFLKEIDEVETVEKNTNGLKAVLNAPLASEELSEKLAKAQIFVTHLAKKKPSLEDQFLSLTQNQ
ncbi:MAG: ATP-binding cassette domain-containing protein [Flavobacteriaceae bacterium]|jgi:ABC-2 type transport system ATP-binding protein|nr:ATP-binding cassette domain-containing protein [Flavobacteriaceae bacterium]MDG2386454.1 ATP-binding cassette domain-containing protein [Flavobacteriaceae bacterium]